MSIVTKQFAYDWMGTNEWLFRKINSLDGNPTYDSFMVFLSNVGEHENFPYFLLAIIVYALMDILVKKFHKGAGSGQAFVVWVGVLSVFVASYAADGIAVKLLKEDFAYPRPYMALDSINVLGEKKTGDGYHSFPSGHASFITVLVSSLWPALIGKMPLFGVLLVFGVCWSRIAMGMHFPADVLTGFMLSFIIVLAVRFFVYTLFAKLFKWKC